MEPAIEYQLMRIDVKLIFKEHVENACQKTVSAKAVLTEMLPNVGGVDTVGDSF